MTRWKVTCSHCRRDETVDADREPVSCPRCASGPSGVKVVKQLASIPDPTTLVQWHPRRGDKFDAAYGADTLEVWEVTDHIWRSRVTGPTRGVYVGGAASCEGAMLDALRHVGHPDAQAVHDEDGEPLIDRANKRHRLASLRERFCDRIEREDGMGVSAFVRVLETLLDYAYAVEADALEREARVVDPEREEIVAEDLKVDARADAIAEADPDEEREEVEAP